MLINDDPKGALVPGTPYGKALEMWFDKKYYNFLKELEQTFGCSSEQHRHVSSNYNCVQTSKNKRHIQGQRIFVNF